MRKLTIPAAIAALSILISSAALADERVSASATLLDPVSHTYVGTFVEDCSSNNPHGGLATPYIGVYLEQSFQMYGSAYLSVATGNGLVFSTAPRAQGEENWVTEVGGASRKGCLADGSQVNLLYSPGGMLPIRLLATGTVKFN